MNSAAWAGAKCLLMTLSCTMQLLVPALILFSAACKTVSDVKKWTIHNKFRLNGDYTEALLFDPSKSFDPPDVLRIGQSDIPFSNFAQSLDVTSDNGQEATS